MIAKTYLQILTLVTLTVNISAYTVLSCTTDGPCTCSGTFTAYLGYCHSECASNEYNDEGTCTACGAGKEPSQYKDSCVCSGNTYDVAGTCTACGTNEKVKSDGSGCVCKDTYTLISGSCVCQSDQIEEDDACVNCPGNSFPNSDQTACICPDDEIFSDVVNNCVSCPTNGDLNGEGVCECTANFVPIEEQCLCQDHEIVKEGKCVICPGNSKPNDDKNHCLCEENQIFNDHTQACQECPHNLVKSDDGISCVCPEGFILEGNECVCPNHKVEVNKQCILCPDNSYPDEHHKGCLCTEGFIPNNKFYAVQKITQNQGDLQEILEEEGEQDYCIEAEHKEGYQIKLKNPDDGGMFYEAEVRCEETFVLVGGQCVCQDHHYEWNGRCRRCPEGTLLLPGLNYCVCDKPDEIFDEDSCECNKCPKNEVAQVYLDLLMGGDNTHHADIGKAYKNVWIKSQTCVCNKSFMRQNGVCQCKPTDIEKEGKCHTCPGSSFPNQEQTECVCPENFFLDDKLKDCRTCDPIREVFNVDREGCSCAYSFKLINGECVCNDHQILLNQRCEDCPNNTFPNANKDNCICAENQYFDQETQTCTTCGTNEEPNDEQNGCKCIDSFLRISDACACPSDTILVDGVCELCTDVNAFPNAGQTECICADNYTKTASGACITCGDNEAVTPDDTCVCKLTYVEDANGDCILDAP